MTRSTRSARHLAALALVLLVAAQRGFAQQAPEGNAHPQPHALSEQGEHLANPFGEGTSGMASDRKHAMTEVINLEPLRALPLWHNGRVKILDTLARENVESITGRTRYAEDFEGKALKYDPLFTLLDLMIDPSYYDDKPLIAVHYLPLRRLLVERAFPSDDRAINAWLHTAKVSPAMVRAYAPAVIEQIQSLSQGQQPMRQGLDELDAAVELAQKSWANLVLLPDGGDRPWRHIGSLPPSHEILTAASALGNAWRAGDGPAINRAIVAFAKEVKREQQARPGAPSEDRASLELAYNQFSPFGIGMWLYAGAFVLLLLAFTTGRRSVMILGSLLLGAGLVAHGGGFLARCVIAQRYAIQNQFESMTGLGLLAVLAGGVLMLTTRRALLGAAAGAVGFLVLLTATRTGIPGETIQREAAILNTSSLLKYHVTTVLFSYALITLGFFVSVFYLGQHYLGGRPGQGELTLDPVQSREKTLADLDTAQMTVLQLAFWALGVGILLGAWWADHSWGRWWAFDPKETWALITWIIYLIVIHVRFAAPRKRALLTAWLSVAGFVMMLWTYFGVNLLLPGLHAYA